MRCGRVHSTYLKMNKSENETIYTRTKSKYHSEVDRTQLIDLRYPFSKLTEMFSVLNERTHSESRQTIEKTE